MISNAGPSKVKVIPISIKTITMFKFWILICLELLSSVVLEVPPLLPPPFKEAVPLSASSFTAFSLKQRFVLEKLLRRSNPRLKFSEIQLPYARRSVDEREKKILRKCTHVAFERVCTYSVRGFCESILRYSI